MVIINSNIGFFFFLNNQVDITLRQLIRDFIHVHLVCKFQAGLIKSKRVMLIIKSTRSYGPIWPGFELIRNFIPSSCLQVSERSDQN